MPSSSTSTSSSSSSLLATAAAAVLLLCSSLFVSPAFAADFVAPGSVELQPPPSRAQGLARSSRGSSSGSSSSSLTAAAPSPPPSIELLSGSVRVADGDTVEITSFDDEDKTQTVKHKVRIWGIDAPETKQLCRDAAGEDYECGRRAAERMRAALGAEATCEVKARDQYGRAVARCFPGIRTEEDLLLSGGEDGDAGLALVASGDAVAYGKFSRGFYEPAERAAREKKKGIWAGEFEVPEDWRREQRIKTLQNVAAQRAGAAAAAAPSPGGGPLALAPKPTLPSPSPTPTPSPSSSSRATAPSRPKENGEKRKGGCDIKGNISSNNARRYHVPGTASYDSVKIDEAKGERWFCSEAEAEAAGWEKAKYGGRPPQKEKEEKSVESEDEQGGGGGGAAPSTDAEVEAAAEEEGEGE